MLAAGGALASGAVKADQAALKLEISLVKGVEQKPPTILLSITNLSSDQPRPIDRKFVSHWFSRLEMFDGKEQQWVWTFAVAGDAGRAAQGSKFSPRSQRLTKEQYRDNMLSLGPGATHRVILEPADWFCAYNYATGHGTDAKGEETGFRTHYYDWYGPAFVEGDPVRLRWAIGDNREEDFRWVHPPKTTSNEVLLSREDIAGIMAPRDQPPGASGDTAAHSATPWAGIAVAAGLVLLVVVGWATWRRLRAALTAPAGRGADQEVPPSP